MAYGLPVVGAAALMAMGDVLAQYIERSGTHQKYSAARTVKQTAYGLFFGGPSCIAWYCFLERYVRFGVRPLQLVARIAADQLLFSPTTLCVYFAYGALVDGEGVSGVCERMRKHYPQALLNNWRVWPAVQVLSFNIAPLHFRLLFVNTVGVAWNAYMSHLSNSSVRHSRADNGAAAE